MKSILHLKDDTEYQIPLRETEKDDRAEVGTTKAKKAANKEKVKGGEKTTATQLQNGPTAKKKTDEISREEVTNEEGVNNENDPALDNLEEENPNQEPPNTEESNSDINIESAPQVDSAKAALDEMKKLASQEGVIHPSLFISNFSKILGLMERAMQLQVKESGSATKESGSVTKEEASGATEEKTSGATEEKTSESTEQTETPAEGKQGELNGNNRS